MDGNFGRRFKSQSHAAVPDLQHRDFQQWLQAVRVADNDCFQVNAKGEIDTLWPGYTWEYWLQTRSFTPSDYMIR